jgi:hypothetical protein
VHPYIWFAGAKVDISDELSKCEAEKFGQQSIFTYFCSL